MATIVIAKPVRQKSRLMAWLPTLLWLVMIAVFSTDTFSATHTRSFLENFLGFFWPRLTMHRLQMLNLFVRKAAHFSVYGMLGLLSFISWRATLRKSQQWTFTWSGLALLLTLLAASSDEFHQSFVPSRTSSANDVVLDMMGALFVQILIASFSKAGPRTVSSRRRMPVP